MIINKKYLQPTTMTSLMKVGGAALVLLGAAVGALMSGSGCVESLAITGSELSVQREAEESSQSSSVQLRGRRGGGASGGYRPNKPFALKQQPKNFKAAIQEIRDYRMNEEEETTGGATNNEMKKKATFLQIGANDGQYNDQLYPTIKDDKDSWIGLMVEPQPILYSKLTLLHADVANEWSFYMGVVVGSCNDKGYVTFCETKTPGEGGTFTQGQVNGVRSVCNTKTMIEVNRPCVKSFKDLLTRGSPAFHQKTTQPANNNNNKEGVHYVDLIVIDAEGKDDEVIATLDPTVIQATCLFFEHKHIAKQDKKDGTDHLQQTHQKLKDMGFNKFTSTHADTLACRVEEE